MSAKIASKQKRIADIAEMLEKGLERKAIMQQLAKSCKASARTLDNEIKEAKNIVFERNKQKEQVRQEQTTQTLKEAVNAAVISDLEIEAILCKVVTGNMEVEEFIKGTPILRSVSPMEIVAAAKAIYAKRGSNAPAKSSIELTEAPKIILPGDGGN